MHGKQVIPGSATVHEHHLDIMERQLITMPREAKVLSASVVGHGISLFTLEEDSAERFSRKFTVIPTGRSVSYFEKTHQFIDTVTLQFEPTVGHSYSTITVHIFEEL
jgi:hypothetical protein